jgi:hypothetical protein
LIIDCRRVWGRDTPGSNLEYTAMPSGSRHRNIEIIGSLITVASMRGVQEEMIGDIRAKYGEHRRADAQTSCHSAGSSDTGHHRTKPLFITGYKSKDAALGKPRIRAGEIIGWRVWKLFNGLLHSTIVAYTWRPGVFERSEAKEGGPCNFGYHAFRDKEQAEREAATHWSPIVVGSVAMWGEVIEHQHGWRSEYAAVRSIIKIKGDFGFWSRQCLLRELREKYGCRAVATEL